MKSYFRIHVTIYITLLTACKTETYSVFTLKYITKLTQYIKHESKFNSSATIFHLYCSRKRDFPLGSCQ